MEPTEVQKASLAHLERRADMMIAAKTGQGKTLCFGLPILDSILREGVTKKQGQRLRGLIISPTRELALQIQQHLQAVIPQAESQEDEIKLATLVGEMSKEKQERLLSYKPSIVIATPGRLWEFMHELSNEYLTSELPLIDFLVIDEADRMIEVGHFKELH
jgi:ATP-dependent RNA helicase DDX24/MAK5